MNSSDLTPHLLAGLRKQDALQKNEEVALSGLLKRSVLDSFMVTAFLLMGMFLILCSTAYFISTNNYHISTFIKFLVLESVLVLLVLLAAIVSLQNFYGKLLLWSAMVLVGLVLFLIQQTYPSHMQMYDILAFWGVLVFGWALISKTAAMWCLWLLIVSLAFQLWWYDVIVIHYDDDVIASAWLGLVYFALLHLRDFLVHQKKCLWLQAPWTRYALLSAMLFCALHFTIQWIINIDNADLVLWLGGIAGFVLCFVSYYSYRYKYHDFYAVALTVLAICVIAEAIALRALWSPGPFGIMEFSIMLAVTIGLFTLTIVYLRNLRTRDPNFLADTHHHSKTLSDATRAWIAEKYPRIKKASVHALEQAITHKKTLIWSNIFLVFSGALSAWFLIELLSSMGVDGSIFVGASLALLGVLCHQLPLHKKNTAAAILLQVCSMAFMLAGKLMLMFNPTSIDWHWGGTVNLVIITVVTYPFYKNWAERFVSVFVSLWLIWFNTFVYTTPDFPFNQLAFDGIFLAHLAGILFYVVRHLRTHTSHSPIFAALCVSISVVLLMIASDPSVQSGGTSAATTIIETFVINWLTACGALVLLAVIAKHSTLDSAQKITFALMALCVLFFAILSLHVLVFCLFLLCAGYFIYNKGLLALVACLIVGFVTYYHDNHWILMINKSAYLMLSGLVLLAAGGCAYYLKKKHHVS